jgi:hypothetical protein
MQYHIILPDRCQRNRRMLKKSFFFAGFIPSGLVTFIRIPTTIIRAYPDLRSSDEPSAVRRILMRLSKKGGFLRTSFFSSHISDEMPHSPASGSENSQISKS